MANQENKMNHAHLFNQVLEKSNYFIPHGHCYLWIPSLLWLHVISDLLIGLAYIGISLILYILVRRIRLPFSPVFIAFGLFIGLCGLTHFMKIWTVWNPDYWIDGWLKAGTAAASVATAIGLLFVRPQVEEVVHAARLSEERRIKLESTNAELEALYKKVKDLDQLKTQFFANVSHELRTPLALMLGPAERMREDDNLTEAQRRQLESISKNGKTLLKQVNDLLDVSKLEAGKMQVQYSRLDVTSWLKRIASQFELIAEQKQIRYSFTGPNHLLAEVDPEMLERVFINLLSNAYKFTPHHGQIDVRLDHANDGFSFSVSDSGPGIESSQRNTVFERFRQAEGGATRRYGGTGLGLAIVKDFVDLHGGKISVGVSPAGGAVFEVHLPLAAPAGTELKDAPIKLDDVTQAALEGAVLELSSVPENGEDASAPAQVPGRPSVLVVEDNVEMRNFIADVISEEYNVVTAADGQEGLERATALRPDLIITDIMMPRLSGDQLVKALRLKAEFDTVPILLLTAKADDDLRVMLIQNGAQDYLNKPFMPQELQARVGNWIAVKRVGDTLRQELSSASDDIEVLASELSIKHRQLQTALDAAEVARQQAESANQVKGAFLALVSHELRTPLSTIHLNLQLLAVANESTSSPVAATARDRLVRATEQMSNLVEGLLQYTRVQSGNLRIQPENIDSAALAEEVVAAHAGSVQSGVSLLLEPPPTLPLFVSDQRLLRVVLSNLLSNALKFTQAGTVSLSIAAEGDKHIFSVQDTGIGIPQADQQRIFLAFEQLEPVHRKSIPGVGLGLALVKQIVDALGGQIEVDSQTGAGTRFTVRLPSRPPHTDVEENNSVQGAH